MNCTCEQKKHKLCVGNCKDGCVRQKNSGKVEQPHKTFAEILGKGKVIKEVKV